MFRTKSSRNTKKRTRTKSSLSFTSNNKKRPANFVGRFFYYSGSFPLLIPLALSLGVSLRGRATKLLPQGTFHPARPLRVGLSALTSPPAPRAIPRQSSKPKSFLLQSTKKMGIFQKSHISFRLCDFLHILGTKCVTTKKIGL